MRLARRGGGLGSGDLPLICGRITLSKIRRHVFWKTVPFDTESLERTGVKAP